MHLNSALSVQLPVACLQILFLMRIKLCTLSTQPQDRKSEDASDAILKNSFNTHSKKMRECSELRAVNMCNNSEIEIGLHMPEIM